MRNGRSRHLPQTGGELRPHLSFGLASDRPGPPAVRSFQPAQVRTSGNRDAETSSKLTALIFKGLMPLGFLVNTARFFSRYFSTTSLPEREVRALLASPLNSL